MRKYRPLKKFIHNKGATIFLSVLVVGLLLVYGYMNFRVSKLSIQISNFENSTPNKNEVISEHNQLQTYSEMVLVVFSVAASALVSSLLIERRSSNKIVEDLFVDDFFTSDKFLGILDDEKQKQILKSLEKQLKFDGCNEKSEMYLAIREKINTPIFDEDLFYEKYYLKLNCEIKEDYIEKTFIRCVELKSLPKTQRVKDFKLLCISTPKSNNYKPAEITKLKINGAEEPLSNIKITKKEPKSQLDKNSGYNQHIDFTYSKVLNFSNKTPIKIEVEYITRCPVNDKVYACRLQYPCKKFDFDFHLKNDDYVINASAFGFIDDANASPNHSNDTKNVAIKFEDWIFPRDGVCVCLEKSVAN